MKKSHLKINIGLTLIYCLCSSYASMNPDQEAHQIIFQMNKIKLGEETVSSNLNIGIKAISQSSAPSKKEDLESVITKPNNIPLDVWRHITSYLDYRFTKLHSVNRYFFNVVTDYPSNAITHTGFKHHLALTYSSHSQIQGVEINFNPGEINFNLRDIKFNEMPSYMWYSLVNKVIGIPQTHWINVKNTCIRFIDLSNSRIGVEGIRKLGQALKGTQVHTLILRGNEIRDASELGQTLKETQIHTIDLSYNKIDAEGIRKFGQALKETQVHTLILRGNEIRDASEFGQTLKETQIHTIDLSYNKIDAEGIRKLGQALKGTQVHTLILRGNEIRDASELGQTLKETQIHTIDLSYNKIDAEGIRKFGQALKETQVHTLILRGNEIRDASEFGQTLKETQIHTVDLSYNKIDAEGIRKLSQALKGTQVHTLILRGNEIRDASELGQTLKETQIHTVDLKGNYIDKNNSLNFGLNVRGFKIQVII